MAAGDDYTVGVAQSGSPDRYIDNEQQTNDAGTLVARQKVATPRSDAIMSQLNRVLGILGMSFDVAGRQRSTVETFGSAATLPAVTAVGTVTTVTTVTTVGSVTSATVAGITAIGGNRAEMDQMAQINGMALANRSRITVAP